MISIYCTTPFYLKDCYLFTIVERLTEEELLNLVKEDRNAIWFVQPHGSSVFRTKFMDGCLDKAGYVIEGVFHTELCGEPVDYRVIEDINTKMARETKRANVERNGKPANLVIESFQIQGARQMLMRLLDVYDILPKGKKRKDDEVYTKAEMDLILSSKDATRHFLCGDLRIHYRGHERDKKGRLVKVEAYFAE